MSADAVDPQAPRYALEGRVVTMDRDFLVLPAGRVYVAGGNIVAVLDADAAVPADLDGVPVIRTHGTIYPGLIELHNHLSYNVLRLWDVPQKYTARAQWQSNPEYYKGVKGPMIVLGQTPGYVEAVVRYVECRCLLGGVTTSQGLALSSNADIKRYYRGIVRNVEETDDPALPDADGHISDVQAVDAQAFLARLHTGKLLLLHLSEGTDASARQHFADLCIQPAGEWAINRALVGIHGVALEDDDFRVLKEHDGSLVWSPLSNLLLYGATARVESAKAHGLRMGLGADWSPSGSKSLFWELKIARLVSRAKGSDAAPLFSDRELLAMATRNAAEILEWDGALGTVAPGKRADLLVIAGHHGDPYAHLLEASERAISLVTIGGVRRYGQPHLMHRLGGGTEEWLVGGETRLLNLQQADADPVVGQLTLRTAADRLRDGLQRLPALAADLEKPQPRDLAGAAPAWTLVLDQEEPGDRVSRTYFGAGAAGLADARGLAATRALAAPLSQILEPLELDPLTVADDPTFLDRLRAQRNLPAYLAAGLAGLPA